MFLCPVQPEVSHIARISVKEQTLLLHPGKAAYWKERCTLIVSDLHLGKATHFRRNGMPMPSGVIEDNLKRLGQLLSEFDPVRVIVLGDLFHSEYNHSWEKVIAFITEQTGREFILVEGNHDILCADHYVRAGISCVGPVFVDGPFVFSHYPVDDLPNELYCIHGHIHPGARLRGRGKQSVVLPCFCFGERVAIFPAFGSFTGLAKLRFETTDRVFGVAEGKVIALGDAHS